jgi:hypothetical protein
MNAQPHENNSQWTKANCEAKDLSSSFTANPKIG